MAAEEVEKKRRSSMTGAGLTSSGNGNLWESMLRDAMRRNRLPDGTLLFVGPQGCGKSSLLDTFLEGSASSANPSGGAAAAAMTSAIVAPIDENRAEGGGTGSGGGGGNGGGSGGAGGGSSGAGAGNGNGKASIDPIGHTAVNARGFHPVLAYSYLDAADPVEQGPERDDSPSRVSAWCCSDLEFEGLLQTVLRPEQVSNTVVVVAVDLSRPWEIMDSVEKWTAVVEKHVAGLLKQLSVGAQDDLRGAVKDRLMAARAGVDGVGAKDGNNKNSSSSNNGANGSSRFKGGGKDPPGGGLGEGVLEKNIGVPMVVVGCKADSLQSETFEQQQRLHFIQQSLRRFCLKYGAALVYTSAKDGVNCGLLHRYLLSCLYPGAFPSSEEGQTSDAAFIPAGWDSRSLIDGLLSPSKTPWGPTATFTEVVVAPSEAARQGGGGGRGHGSGSGNGGVGVAPGEEEVEAVESEEAWLSSLGKQVAGADGVSRWPSALAAASKVAKSSKARSPRTNAANVPDPRSFFANLLAGGSSSMSSPSPQQRKKP